MNQEEHVKRIRFIRVVFILAIVCLVVVFTLEIFVTQTQMTENVSDFLLGLASGILIFGVISTTRRGRKLETYKKKLLNRN